MIEVEVIYIRKKTKTYLLGTNELYYYPYFSIKGHANKGNDLDKQVCAGITAIVSAFPNFIGANFNFHTNDINYCSECDFRLGRGVFEVSMNEKQYTKNYDISLRLDTMLYQLMHIYNMYPSYFSKFEIREKGSDY